MNEARMGGRVDNGVGRGLHMTWHLPFNYTWLSRFSEFKLTHQYSIQDLIHTYQEPRCQEAYQLYQKVRLRLQSLLTNRTAPFGEHRTEVPKVRFYAKQGILIANVCLDYRPESLILPPLSFNPPIVYANGTSDLGTKSD